MDEPGPLLERLKRGAENALVDELSQTVKVLQRGVPTLHENFRGQLAPHTVEVVDVGGLDQDAMEIEVLAGSGVVAALVLNLNSKARLIKVSLDLK